MVESRALFGLERVWLVADQLWPPFVNQLVVEGEGSLSRTEAERAFAVLLPAWPGARARCVGWLSGARWVADGAPPRVCETTGWDGYAPHPALSAPLDPFSGPIVELVLFPGRVVLRTHHAAFDGRAAWALAEDLGAALRGEPVRGARFVGVTEPLGGSAQPEPLADSPMPSRAGAEGGMLWVRRTLPSARKQFLPRTLLGVARAIGAPVRLSVPVDLRRHLPADQVRVCANLTGFVRVNVAPDDTAEAVASALAAALVANEDLASVRGAGGVRNVPLWAMRAAGKSAAGRAMKSGFAPVTGTVSNLGRADAGVIDHPGFVGRACFWIPPANLGSPLFVTLTGHGRGVELVVAMPAELGGGGVIERLAASL